MCLLDLESDRFSHLFMEQQLHPNAVAHKSVLLPQTSVVENEVDEFSRLRRTMSDPIIPSWELEDMEMRWEEEDGTQWTLLSLVLHMHLLTPMECGQMIRWIVQSELERVAGKLKLFLAGTVACALERLVSAYFDCANKPLSMLD